MILFHNDISFGNRIFSQMGVLTLILLFIAGIIWATYHNDFNWVVLLAYSFPMIVFFNSLYKSVKDSTYWISLIEIDDNNICHIVINKKNIVVKNIHAPKEEWKFVLKPFEGRFTYYKMFVYLNNDLLTVQCAVDDWGRYQMQKIIQYFHPDDKMAKKNRL